MGEDQADDLQEQEELQDAEELQGLEDALAEEYAAEDGGTGLSFYDESGYDYDASSPLTDVDYQSGTDESSQFTSNGTGSEAYDPVNRDNDDNEDGNKQGIWGDVNRWNSAAPQHTNQDNEDAEDDYDDEQGSGGADDDDEDEDDDEDDEDEEQVVGVAQGQAGNKDEYDGAIQWRPGQPITVKLLDQIWGKCRNIKQVRPLVDTLNQMVEAELNLTGPNMMLRLNKYIEKTMDNELDTVGCLLRLAKQNGKRMVYTALSVVEAIFDQQWTQTALLASFNEATLQGIFNIPQVKTVATSILTIAVPKINKQSKKNNQQQSKKSMVDRIHDAKRAQRDAHRPR